MIEEIQAKYAITDAEALYIKQVTQEKAADLGAKHRHSLGYGEHLQRRSGAFWRDERA